MNIRIILADDHDILRHGLCRSLEQEQDLKVVGQARDGRSTVERVKELLPDVVVMDVAMPNLNGVEATRQIAKEYPDVKVIALSMYDDNKYVREMFRAGARGYLLKDCSFDELVQAIRTVITGKIYVSPSVGHTVIEDYINKPYEKSAFLVLSEREREILQLLAEGKTIKQAAMQLHISSKTAQAHRLQIMNKLKIDNLAQLTKYAIQEGLTLPEPKR